MSTLGAILDGNFTLVKIVQDINGILSIEKDSLFIVI